MRHLWPSGPSDQATDSRNGGANSPGEEPFAFTEPAWNSGRGHPCLLSARLAGEPWSCREQLHGDLGPCLYSSSSARASAITADTLPLPASLEALVV